MAPIEYPPLKPGNFLRALEAKVPQKFVRDILNRLRFILPGGFKLIFGRA